MELEGIVKSVEEERIAVPNVFKLGAGSDSGSGVATALTVAPSGGSSGPQSHSLGRSMGIGGQYYSSSTGSAGTGSVTCGGSYHHHPYSQHLSQCGRNNRRRSLPPSPFTSEGGSFETRQKIFGGSGNHPQQQQQQQQQQYHQKHSRKMRRYNKKLSKRLRRATQPAPNNNNEFLMQEHDPLFHLDQDFNDHATEEDSNSDEQNNHGHHGHDSSRTHRSIHLYSSSPEDDEEDFLAKDFSNAYEVVHAERLFNMSKHQLIHEYQLMEERVELLENKLRSALLERSGLNPGPGQLNEDGIGTTPICGNHVHVKSEAIPVPVPSNHNNTNNSNLLTSALLSSSGASANEDDNDNDMSVSHLSSSQSSLPDEEEERFQYFCT